MSSDRRRRRRRQRRQSGGGGYQPAGPVQFTGVMGFFQRHTGAFFLVGIVVMVLSLGGAIFASRVNRAAQNAAPTPTAEASATPTSSATVTPTVQHAYSAPPPMTIDTNKTYDAVIHLETGAVFVHLLPKEAPEYVNNFVFLAEHHFYDGLTFLRVVPGFVAQAGDPNETGYGDAGYALTEEHNSIPFDAGVISMAKAGARVSGSQFFITLAPAGSLNGDFTVFGRVTSGLDLLQALPARDPTQPDQPPGATILSIDITEGS